MLLLAGAGDAVILQGCSYKHAEQGQVPDGPRVGEPLVSYFCYNEQQRQQTSAAAKAESVRGAQVIQYGACEVF